MTLHFTDSARKNSVGPASACELHPREDTAAGSARDRRFSANSNATVTALRSGELRADRTLAKGTIPLVFWDEFDTNEMAWLAYFLSPMQDAEFRSGSDMVTMYAVNNHRAQRE